MAGSTLAVALVGLVGPQQWVYTTELKMNLPAPVSDGELTAEARIGRRSRRVAVGEVEVKNNEGQLVAKGLSTFSISR